MDSKTLTPTASEPTEASPAALPPALPALSLASATTTAPAAVSTAPKVKRGRGLRRALALLVGSVLLVVICVALLAPPLLALAGGVWAVVTEVRAIAAIWTLARRGEYGAIFAHLGTLDTASRIAFVGVSFFALLFALMLLMAGLLGRRWGRLFIAPGVVFTLPTLLCFTVAWLLMTPVAVHFGFSPLAQTSAAVYALLDAIVLAAALCDMRPTLRRARRVARLGKRTRPSLPAIRITGRHTATKPAQWRETRGRRDGLAGPKPASLDLADDVDEGALAYPPPQFALRAPITRPMAAIRVEDVARGVASDADESDDLDDLHEAETWRIFSGEWAAWGTDDTKQRQVVTLPALDANATGDDEASATTAEGVDDAMMSATPVAPPAQILADTVTPPTPTAMDVTDAMDVAPTDALGVTDVSLADTMEYAAIAAIAEEPELADTPTLLDVPLALAPVE